MISLNDKSAFLIAVVLYAIGAIYGIFLIRAGFRRDDRINYLILLSGFLFQTFAMYFRGLSFARCPVHNLYEAIMFVSWSIALAYLVIGIHPRLRFLGAYAAPLLFGLGLLALMPNMDQTIKGSALENPKLYLNLHATLILLSYGLFGISALSGIMYVTQSYNLKFNRVKAFFSLLPPMERIMKVMVETMVAGVILLTAGMIIGAVALKPPAGTTFSHDPKVQWTAVVWIMYAILLSAYKFFSLGSRKFAIGAIGSFAFIALTFWGVNMISKIHNP